MTPTTDPLELLRSIDSTTIQDRLEKLQAESDSLRVLLRLARARERGRRATPHQSSAPVEGVRHAD
jgi:hypothetical protein